MSLKLIHAYNESLTLFWNDQPLFQYVYMPGMSRRESPRPYFHPVYTLRGNVVTNCRPHDHVWHHGISMTIAHLDDQNFWGGNSYRHEQGYIPLPNNGRQRHDRWTFIDFDHETFRAGEQLSWITQAGGHWISETRSIALGEIAPREDYWSLDVQMRLQNVREESLTIGSPSTAGRLNAGYGGLFWRGPRCYAGCKVIAAGKHTGAEIMGQSAPWLAYLGLHDGTTDGSGVFRTQEIPEDVVSPARTTVLFFDHPHNIRYPNKWFMRNQQYVGASFAFMFDEVYVLDPGQTLDLRYRIGFAHGHWTRDQISEKATAWQASG